MQVTFDTDSPMSNCRNMRSVFQRVYGATQIALHMEKGGNSEGRGSCPVRDRDRGFVASELAIFICFIASVTSRDLKRAPASLRPPSRITTYRAVKTRTNIAAA